MSCGTFRYPRNRAPKEVVVSLNANGQPHAGHAGSWASTKSPRLRPIPLWLLFERSNAFRSTEVTRVPVRASRKALTPLLKVVVCCGKSLAGDIDTAEVMHSPGPPDGSGAAEGPPVTSTGAGWAAA